VPVSSYRFGPPGRDSVYYTPPMGRIGVHHPREIVRVERDYTGGEIVQFASVYPMELEGRITPRQFMESINAINEILISANSLWHSVFDNGVEIFSLQLSRLVISTHYEREMKRLQRLIDDLNRQLFNLAGLNMLWPRKVGFLFLEIEYY
ncbi:Golgin subfamily A member 7/ERF4 family-domain-containing protein, partial [Russula emetica]